MQYLFHVSKTEELAFDEVGLYAPASLRTEGFVHASFKERVVESARLYFAADAALTVLAIDPRRLDVRVEIAATPRGPMPHVFGPIPRDAVKLLALDAVESHPEVVTGTRIALLAFQGMTLLDLVGPLDALSRIASMGFDPTTSCEVIGLTDAGVWEGCGMSIRVARHHAPLDAFDVVVVPGGPRTRSLESDADVVAYLKTFPRNRLLASVCTGALLLGAAGRLQGRRATTHPVAMSELAGYGATPVRARVVDDGQIVTSGGVTAGIDLGLHLVTRLAGREVAAAIGERMDVHPS